jgi:hypothetical protein
LNSGDEGTFDPAEPVDEGGNGLEWEVRLWEQRPERRWVVLAVALAAGAFGFFMLHSLLLGLIGMAVIFISTAEMFLPVRFRLDAKGATRKCGLSTTFLEWENTRRLIDSGGIIRVSPLVKPSALDAFRGVPLKLSGNREAVLAKISELWQSDEHSLSGETEPRGGGEADRTDLARDSSSQAGNAGDSVS